MQVHVHTCALALLEGNRAGFTVKLAIIVQFKNRIYQLSTKLMDQANHTRQKQDTIEHSMALFKGYGCYFVDTALPPGIANPSNNCYLNSTLQCLLNSSPFPTLLIYYLQITEPPDQSDEWYCPKCSPQAKKSRVP